MIKHIVMWKLKDSDDGFSKAENTQRMKAWLEELKPGIKEIKHLEVGINFNSSPAAYDIVLYSEFDDKHALASYQDHPYHVRFKERIADIRTDRVVVDYEI